MGRRRRRRPRALARAPSARVRGQLAATPDAVARPRDDHDRLARLEVPEGDDELDDAAARTRRPRRLRRARAGSSRRSPELDDERFDDEAEQAAAEEAQIEAERIAAEQAAADRHHEAERVPPSARPPRRCAAKPSGCAAEPRGRGRGRAPGRAGRDVDRPRDRRAHAARRAPRVPAQLEEVPARVAESDQRADQARRPRRRRAPRDRRAHRGARPAARGGRGARTGATTCAAGPCLPRADPPAVRAHTRGDGRPRPIAESQPYRDEITAADCRASCATRARSSSPSGRPRKTEARPRGEESGDGSGGADTPAAAEPRRTAAATQRSRTATGRCGGEGPKESASEAGARARQDPRAGRSSVVLGKRPPRETWAPPPRGTRRGRAEFDDPRIAAYRGLIRARRYPKS